MRTTLTIFAMAFALALSTSCLADTSDAKAEDTKAVEQVNNEFYTSLNAVFAGDIAPMKAVWSHADDVTYMGPVGGFQVGWDQVSALWEAQTALKLGGKIVPREVHTTVGNDLAVINCYEVGDNLSADGDPVDVTIRATTLFRKENGQWKVIGHHTDLLPFLQVQEALTSDND